MGGGTCTGFPAGGVNLYSKLDLRPEDSYDQNIDAVERLVDGEFDEVGDVFPEMHPRVFHEAFRRPYQMAASPVKVDEESLEEMREVLEEKSEESHSWINRKLFNAGYSRMMPGPENIADLFDNPEQNYGRDLLPDSKNILLDNPYREGREKWKGDMHYGFAAEMMAHELFEEDLEVV